MAGCLCPHRYPSQTKRLGRSTRFLLRCPAHVRHRSSLVFLGVVGLAMAIYMAGCCCGSRYARRRPKTASGLILLFFLPALVPHTSPGFVDVWALLAWLYGYFSGRLRRDDWQVASENKRLAMTTPRPGGSWSSMKGRLLYPYTPGRDMHVRHGRGPKCKISLAERSRLFLAVEGGSGLRSSSRQWKWP